MTPASVTTIVTYCIGVTSYSKLSTFSVGTSRQSAMRATALGRDDAAAVRAVYSLDVGFPLSLTQAFGIALTQLNSSSIFDCR